MNSLQLTYFFKVSEIVYLLIDNNIGNYLINVWNEPLQALDSMLMHTKLNLRALIRKATSPH